MNLGDNTTPGAQPQSPEASHSASLAYRAWAQCNRLPSKAKISITAGAAALIALALYTCLSAGSAVLNIVCRHNFRSAEISILVDGKQSYSGEIYGGEKKRLGVGILGKQVEGTFSKSLHLPDGAHVVQVHVTSDGFDQSKKYAVNLQHGADATLSITAQRSGITLTAYHGARISASTEHDSNYLDSLRSMVLTVLGTIVSASVSFVVHEFLKSRKTA